MIGECLVPTNVVFDKDGYPVLNGSEAVRVDLRVSRAPNECTATNKDLNMSQESLDHVVSGAIFDFMGRLTNQGETT